MAGNVKTFLPSPQSQELVEQPAKKARRARRERPSRCRLARSIYEETDLSKLTPRQRILRQKFREQRGSVTSFFLVANNISAETCSEAIERSGESVEEESTGDATVECVLGPYEPCAQKEITTDDVQSCFLVVTSDLGSDLLRSTQEDALSSDDDTVIEAAEVASPFGHVCRDDRVGSSGVCGGCFEDAVKTYYVLERVGSMHRCGVEKPVSIHKHRIRESLRRRTCFSRIRDAEVMFARAVAGLGCCTGPE